MWYRITSCRWDEPERVYKEFEAKSDKEAERIFNEEAQKPSNAWDMMQLFRIKQREVKIHVASVRVRLE